jgi:predicted nucleic acid-binding Zn ribbon protein
MRIQNYRCDKCGKIANVRVRVKMEKIKNQKPPITKMLSKDVGHFCEKCAKIKLKEIIGDLK